MRVPARALSVIDAWNEKTFNTAFVDRPRIRRTMKLLTKQRCFRCPWQCWVSTRWRRKWYSSYLVPAIFEIVTGNLRLEFHAIILKFSDRFVNLGRVGILAKSCLVECRRLRVAISVLVKPFPHECYLPVRWEVVMRNALKQSYRVRSHPPFWLYLTCSCSPFLCCSSGRFCHTLYLAVQRQQLRGR